MKTSEIRMRYLQFFKDRGHAIIPSASLIPQNDASVLFTTAGMHPLVPYLLGNPHPLGTRLVNAQKCVRTGDIDDIGDNRHLTFFEMLGNWSLGDYFKKEAIQWSMEFLTDVKSGLGIDPRRLYVTTFKGEDGIPRDDEAIVIWKKVFADKGMKALVASDDTIVNDDVRIIPLGIKDNFWIAGATGPCGGDTEIFYDTRPEEGVPNKPFEELVDSFRFVEVWNNVFMEFNKGEDGTVVPLAAKNVDTGMGLERTAAVMQGVANVFETDGFLPLIEIARSCSISEKAERIIADHIRAAAFMIADGVTPSNTDRGYVLRRLIRRAVFNTRNRSLEPETIQSFAETLDRMFGHVYEEIHQHVALIASTIIDESQKFEKTLTAGLKELDRILSKGATHITGEQAFTLFASYGFPIEMTKEIAASRSISVDIDGFNTALKSHQDASRAGTNERFKGGLASTGEQEVKYHTATHLLNAALHIVLGDHVIQRGSNITAERLRFDFAHGAKMTDEEKIKVTDLVNSWIKADLPVVWKEMPKAEAEKTGALHAFGEKYGDIVRVYTIGTESQVVSKEFCGGPHVERTGVIGTFTIQKEEAVAAGIRRIKAVLT